MNNEDKERIIDTQLDNSIKAFGCVCVEEPTWCGKTWTSNHHSKSAFFLADSSNNFGNRELALIDICATLIGEAPT